MTTPETHDVSSTGVSDIDYGRVKWFNNKAGYGFITVSKGTHDGEDVFVHHSAIEVSQEQYRYLVQGEYVQFKLCSLDDAKHKWQAGEVRGIGGGSLMCETRLDSRSTRMTRGDVTPMTTESTMSQNTRDTRHTMRDTQPSHYRVRTRGPGPREGDEWMLVRRKPPGQSRSHSQHTTMPPVRQRTVCTTTETSDA
tara:strand:- start:3884 stop:4468 length:585 start_codon:yes stop_codon:yes gene_type:complete